MYGQFIGPYMRKEEDDDNGRHAPQLASNDITTKVPF